MNGLVAGSFLLALIAFAYAIQLGMQIRTMKKKLAALEELERKIEAARATKG
jgi:hypothetical protein